MSQRPSLLFVYGNDSGIVNSLLHSIHKIVSPSTYPCSLCSLTYGPLTQRAAWTRALAKLDAECTFLHRDEMLARHGRDQPPLPAVFLVVDKVPSVLIDKAEIDACRDLDALIALVRERVGVAVERASR